HGAIVREDLPRSALPAVGGGDRAGREARRIEVRDARLDRPSTLDRMLKDGDTYSTIPTSDMARAREFFGETLGLTIARDTEGGVMYRSGSTLFFVYPSRYKAGGHTQMSWFVKDIEAEVAGLKAKGIDFLEYSVPGLEMKD